MPDRRSDWLAPVAVFIALGALAWVGWWNDLRSEREQAAQTSHVLAASTAHQLEEIIEEKQRALDPLGADILAGTVMTEMEFLERAGPIQERNPEIVAVAQLDLLGKVIWSRSAQLLGEYKAGTDLALLPGHAEAIKEASTRRAATLTSVYQLEVGRQGIGLVLPVARDTSVRGLLYAALDGDALIARTIPEPYTSTHSVVVREPGGPRLYGIGIAGEGSNTKKKKVMGLLLFVDAWPRRGIGTSMDPNADIRRLFIYLLASLLISAMVWVALHERHLAVNEADERKSVADSLKVSEARLSDIIARSPWPILEHAPDGTIENANQAAEALIGLPQDQIRDRSILEWTHAEDRDRIRPLITDAATAAGQSYDSRVIDNAGNEHYIRWSRAHRYNELGRITGGILFGQNVTAAVEANRAQEKLIADEERVIERLWVLNDFARSLRTTLDSVSLYQIAIGAATNVLANRPCAILSYDAESDMFEVIAARSASGTPPPLLPGARFPADSTQLKSAVLDMSKLVSDDLGAANTPHEAELARHGYVSRAAVPILLDNTCIGLLAAYSTESDGITRDGIEFLQGIAEHLALALTSSRLYNQLKEAYTETRTAQARIVEMEKLRAVGEMTSGIAHDFNNMLMAIIGNAEFLDEPELGEERLDYVKKILTAASDAAVTVRRLQEYSRTLPEADDFETLDINKIAGDAVDLTRHKWKNQAQGRGVIIDVKKDLDPELLAIRGNAPEIREVLTNLIFNAVDAMPEGGIITVGTGGRGQRAVIFVRDTGTGMTEEVKSKLFTPFFSTKGRSGNGLGLAMSYGIIRKHGGEIDVDSAPGQGTTFSLSFPVSTESVKEDQPPTDRAPMPSLRILVIDDAADVAGAVAAILRKLTHKVKIAESGYEGIKRLREERFDVIVTDLGMPGMSGREVALGAKDVAPNAPVILLTGWGESLREQDDIPPGVDLVLSKPIRLEQLDTALRRVCQPSREKAPA